MISNNQLIKFIKFSQNMIMSQFKQPKYIIREESTIINNTETARTQSTSEKEISTDKFKEQNTQQTQIEDILNPYADEPEIINENVGTVNTMSMLDKIRAEIENAKKLLQ